LKRRSQSQKTLKQSFKRTPQQQAALHNSELLARKNLLERERKSAVEG
jgi:hypothetical protein